MGCRKRAVLWATLPFLAAGNIFNAEEASAQFEATISNWSIEFGLVDPVGGAPITGPDDDDIFLRFDISGTADNGLRYGEIDLDDNQVTSATPTIDEAFLFVGGNFGTVNLDLGPDPFSTGAFNGVGPGAMDFVDFTRPGFNFNNITEATQLGFNTVLDDGFDSVVAAGFNYVASGPDGTFPDMPTMMDAILQWGAITNPVDGRVALEFADQNGLGPQGLGGFVPSQANSTTFLFGLDFRSSEVNLVPLPAAIWFFLGALGSLGALRWLKRRPAG